MPGSTGTSSASPARTACVVVGNDIELTLDVEAILLDDLQRTGAIAYYQPEPTTS